MVLCLGFPDLINLNLTEKNHDQNQNDNVPPAKRMSEQVPTFNSVSQPAETAVIATLSSYEPVHYKIEQDSKNQNVHLISINDKEHFLAMWPGDFTARDREVVDKLVSSDNEGYRTRLIDSLSRDPEFKNDEKMLKINAVNALFYDSTQSIFYLDSAAELLKHPQAQYRMCLFVEREYKNINEDLWERYKPRNNKADMSDEYRPLEYCEKAKSNPLNSSGFADYEIGLRYELGDLLNQDLQKAIEMYQIAAEKGYLPAKTRLGALLSKHESKDAAIQSIVWTEDAANNGDAEAQLNLAEMYKKGLVTGSPEYEAFLEWADRAANQGNAQAMIALGNVYRTGDTDFEPNPKMAADYYWKAAMKKDPEGQFLLAQMYETGQGVHQDKIQAYIHYSQSYYRGRYGPAKIALESLSSKMSASELDHAISISKSIND